MRNESLNNTCILFDPKDEAQQKAIIRFYNDNGWSMTNLKTENFNSIGVWQSYLGYYVQGDLQVIELPSEYYPKIVESDVISFSKNISLDLSKGKRRLSIRNWFVDLTKEEYNELLMIFKQAK